MRADLLAAFDGLLGHLVVDGGRGVEGGEAIGVAGVECLHPGTDDVLRSHQGTPG